VSLCGKISDKELGYLVDQVGSQLCKIHIWGCAQLTDDFFMLIRELMSRIGDLRRVAEEKL
jgi:hypothetical protein